MASGSSSPSGKRRPTQPPAAQTSPARARLEELSRGPLVRLHAMPRWTLPVLMGVLLLAGLLIPSPWAGLLLVVLALFLAWLVALSWPRLTPGTRALRLLVIAVVVFGAYRKLTGRA